MSSMIVWCYIATYNSPHPSVVSMIFSRFIEQNVFSKQTVLRMHTSETDNPLCLEATMVWTLSHCATT
ncbi:hypothetical protein P692DRAFT_20841871 [Suillus brevipes Sb2]|nr:hypothetical protein P692DRAFT_20841871 [Suillus brevipes Sb2]